jgi:hypothetical protein
MKNIVIAAALIGLLVCNQGFANLERNDTKADIAVKVKAVLGLEVLSVKSTSVSFLFHVKTAKGGFYLSSVGNALFDGSLYHFNAGLSSLDDATKKLPTFSEKTTELDEAGEVQANYCLSCGDPKKGQYSFKHQTGSDKTI